MRSLIGLSAANDGPTIVGWGKKIGETFPDMAAYSASDTSATMPWCGQTVAYCMAMNGIRPVFGADDVHRYLYAASWVDFGVKADVPQQGDLVIFKWTGGSDAGGHHVTLLDHVDGASYVCVGGNQSHAVKVTAFPKSEAIAVRRPSGVAAIAAGTVLTRAPSSTYFTAITATEFGGPKDPNKSAYDNHQITDTELGCALPFHFKGDRPTPRIWKNGKSVLVSVVDVGPWYDGRPNWPSDPWWQAPGSRPRAETDQRTNRAGIDLTPAVLLALGIEGKGLVDVEFPDWTAIALPNASLIPSVSAAPGFPEFAEITAKLVALETKVNALQLLPSSSAPLLSDEMLTAFTELLAKLKQGR